MHMNVVMNELFRYFYVLLYAFRLYNCQIGSMGFVSGSLVSKQTIYINRCIRERKSKTVRYLPSLESRGHEKLVLEQ